MESIAGLSVTMLILATLVMAIGAALQAAVGLGLALFVVPLLALIDVRLIPGPMLLASVALAAMMAHRERSAIDRRELVLSLIGLCIGTVVGACCLSLVTPASLTRLFAVLILVAVLISLLAKDVRISPGALLAGGGAAGVMGTMVGIHGPPIALVFQNAEPAQARAMLGAFFAVGYTMSVVALAAVGQFGWREFALGLLLLPGVGFGYIIAPLFARFLDRRRLRIAILTIAGTSAVALLVR
jgi:uncharacterized membrane protein YfcA